MKRFGRMIALGGLLALSTSHAGAQNYAYIGDYAGNQVVRFDATTGTAIAPVPYIRLAQAEGIGGINNLLAVSSGTGVINVYDVNTPGPSLVRSIATPGFAGLRIAFSNDGSKLYAGGYTGYPVPGQVRAYDFASGTLLNTVNEPSGSWGVAVNPLTGNVYYTTGWAANVAGSGAVWRTDGSLGSPTQIVAPNTHGNTNLVGITFQSDGTFYAINGGNTNPGFSNPAVLHYDANGNYLSTLSLAGMPAGALDNAFDTEIGPDGKLYVTSQNGACAVKFDLTTDAYDSIFIPAHAGGLQQAKTIHFAANNVSTVPEPGSVAMFVGMGFAGMSLLARRRRK